VGELISDREALNHRIEHARHLPFIAPIVPDLRTGQACGRSLFGVELVGRKAKLEDGQR
jgi:hypothetical protein